MPHPERSELLISYHFHLRAESLRAGDRVPFALRMVARSGHRASAGTVLSYIFMGGLRASIYTEVLQFFLMVVGILPLSVLALKHVGGLTALLQQVPENMRHTWAPVLNPAGTPFGEGLPAIFVGLIIASFGYWSTDFLVIQRALAAKDLDAAKKTPLIAAFPKMLFPILTVVPGLAALLVIPDAVQGNYTMVLPLMIEHFYPVGLLGVGITALLASFMSGMAGNVTAFNTVWTYDIYQAHVAPGRSDRHYPGSRARRDGRRNFPLNRHCLFGAEVSQYLRLLGAAVGDLRGRAVRDLRAWHRDAAGRRHRCVLRHAGRHPRHDRPLLPVRARRVALRQRACDGFLRRSLRIFRQRGNRLGGQLSAP